MKFIGINQFQPLDKETLRFENIISKYKVIVGNERIYQKVH